MKSQARNGLFIVVDGIDGCGKSSQIETVVQWAYEHGRDVVKVREPGGTPLGERLRTVFLECKKDNTSSVMADVLMLVAAKHQLYNDVIWPALMAGKVVIADRWTDTLYAYQGGGFEMPTATIDSILLATQMSVTPDLVVLLDLPPNVAAGRMRCRKDLSALDQKPLAFFQKVRAVYRARAVKYKHIVKVDAGRPLKVVTRSINRLLKDRFKLSSQLDIIV